MNKRFLLFGEKPFDAYALEKFSAVAANIERMSDIEMLMYKDSFEELVQKTVNAYSLSPIDISFENKVVDLIHRQVRNKNRVFAEYSLVVTGNPYFLGLVPHKNVYDRFSLDAEVKENVLSFEIDTCYHSEELTEAVTAHVRENYMQIKRFIQDSVYNMNRTIVFFNSELEKFVIPLLANKLRHANKAMKIRESLNFR